MKTPCFRTAVKVVPLVVLLLTTAAALDGDGTAKAQHAKIAPNAIESKKSSHVSSDDFEDEEKDTPAIPTQPAPTKPARTAPLQTAPLLPPETQVEPAPPPGVDPDGFEIFRECTLSDSSGIIHGSPTNEPSGGVSDSGKTGAPDCSKKEDKGTRTVFATANKFAAFSADDGATFTQIDLDKIPNFIGRLCCDQVAIFIPKINRFVWVMLVRLTPKPGALQIMAAAPEKIVSSDGHDWSAWSIRPDDLGFTSSGHFDFPGVALGNDSLYVNVDGFGGMLVIRIPLDDIKAGGTLNVEFTDPKKSPRAVLGHTTEDAQDEVFWAQHNSTSQMRVFSWAEGSDSYEWRDIDIDAWPNDPNKMSSITPDCQDWLSGTKAGRIRGAAHFKGNGVDNIWFAWTASAGDSFGQPHVQWVKLDRKQNFKVVDQGWIHDGKLAYAYPALATNSDGDVGVSLETGGGGSLKHSGKSCAGSYENHVVGFLGAGVLHRTTESQKGLSRYGDYVTIHRDSEDKTRFDAFGYGMEPSDGADPSPTTHYIIFGKPPAPPPVCSPCRCLDDYHPPGALCFGTPACQNACVGHVPDTQCMCPDGFKAGPESHAGSEACEHICRGHQTQPPPPPPPN